MVRAVAIVTSLALSSGLARAETAHEPRVAIVPGISVNLDTARVDALSQDLAQALSAELEVQAVGGLEVRRLLPADGLPPDCVTQPKCTRDVARRTNADQLLFVVMVDSGAGGSIQVDTTWVEPATNRSASRPAIDLTSVIEAKNRFAASAHELLPDAKVRPKASGGGSMFAGVKPTMSEGEPRHFTAPSLLTTGVAVAGLGLGIGFGLKTRSLYHTCDANRGTCTSDKRDSIRHWALAADISFAAAIGGAIATGVIYMTSEREPHLIVTPSQEGVGVSWSGHF